jgi:hypothetical protein
MESVEVTAPATIGNIGPGFDVLGLAVKYWGDRLEVRKTESGVKISAINYPRGSQQLSTDPDKNTAGIAARETLRMLGVKQGVDLVLHKGLPQGSGLRAWFQRRLGGRRGLCGQRAFWPSSDQRGTHSPGYLGGRSRIRWLIRG